MEIKVGEYVRLKRGDIFKADEDTVNYYNSNEEYVTNEVVNHSYNIIDLIELGDYVNGYLINYIPNNEKAIYHDASDCEDVEKFENKDIETIVTKEQFAEMEYKV